MFKILIALLLLNLFVFAQTNNEEIKEQYMKSYNYEYAQKYDEAMKILAPLYKEYPKGYTLNLRFAWLSFLGKNYADAIRYYEVASTIHTSSLDPRLGLVRVYLAKQSFEKVQTLSYEVMKIDYYNFYANLYMIQALIAQEKYSVAGEVTHKMLLLYPTSIVFLEKLAIIYKHIKPDALEELYENILILDPNNVFVGNKMH